MQSVRRTGRPLVAPCHIGPGANRACAGNCTHLLRIPLVGLVSSQGNEKVPAVTGVETPVRDNEDEGPCAPPSSAAAEQVAAVGPVGLGFLCHKRADPGT